MSSFDAKLSWPSPREFPSLEVREVHVWAVPLDAGDLPEDSLATVELERARTFALERPRRTFVTTRIALRALLGRYLDLPPRDVPIAFGPNGKPKLAAENLHFNLAHSGDLALIAITSDGPVGVDIEQLRSVENALDLAERNFHPREQAAIRAANVADRSACFLRCWTRKEAVIKAVGVGIGHPLDQFDVFAADTIELSTTKNDPHCYYLHELTPHSDYLAALAATQPQQTPLGFTYSR